MAELEPGSEPEINVDDMDDAAFADLKAKMAGEIATDEPLEPSDDSPAPDTAHPEKAATEPDTGEDDDDPDDDEPDGRKSETVPHGRYHRERERRKAAEQARQEAEQRFAKLAERLAALEEVRSKPADPEPEKPGMPGPDDPVGRLNWTAEQIAEMQERERENQRRQQEEAQERAILERVNADYSQSVQQDESVKQAHEALRVSIGRELMALGYTQEEAIQHINATEMEHARYVASRGMRIGEHIKNLAIARGCWSPQQQPAAPAQPEPDPAQKISEREEARKASMSLGKTGGGVVNTGAISPEQLLDMSDADFEAFVAKHGSVARAFAT